MVSVNVSGCAVPHNGATNASFQGAETALEPATDTARYEFDPAGFSDNTEFPLYISGAELKHARFAILAWLNLVVPGVSRIPFLDEQHLPRRLLGGRASAIASGGLSRWDDSD